MRSTSYNGHSDSILDIVCCTVVSQYLEKTLRTLVTSRLLRLTEHRMDELIFRPQSVDPLEAVQSLLILALWSPFASGAENKIGDRKLLLATAVVLAQNIQLDEMSFSVIQQRNMCSPGACPEVELSELTNKARLVCILPFKSAWSVILIFL